MKYAIFFMLIAASVWLGMVIAFFIAGKITAWYFLPWNFINVIPFAVFTFIHVKDSE